MALSLERWSGKVAVVTGASSGIGAAIARQLVQNGVIVAGFARRIVKVEILAKELGGKKGRLHSVKCDLTNEEDILKAFEYVKEHLGPVHILVNNAGIGSHTSSLSSGDTDKWRKLIETNVIGLCISTREAVQDMKANNVDGHIIHINSILGHSVPPATGISLYPASKYAVTALTETLRHELGNDHLKIKVTSVSPGFVKTEFLKAAGYNKEETQSFADYPYLHAEDVADAVVYALSTPPHVQIHELTIKPVGEYF